MPGGLVPRGLSCQHDQKDSVLLCLGLGTVISHAGHMVLALFTGYVKIVLSYGIILLDRIAVISLISGI